MIALTLDAPMMSFGGPAYDQVDRLYHFPPKSMVVGLLGCALGHDRSESQKLQRLQDTLTYGVREDKRGEVIVDYQTVDLTTPWMEGTWSDGRWTTDVRDTKKDREILRKKYIADAVYTLVLDLPEEEAVFDALRQPHWPLYIGRRACGAAHLEPRLCDYPSIEDALRDLPSDHMPPFRVWIDGQGNRHIAGHRDWSTDIHVGEQRIEQKVVS